MTASIMGGSGHCRFGVL